MSGKYDITILQGETFSLTMTWKDSDGVVVPVTGYSARMQIRRRKTSSTTELSLTSSAGITLGGAAGTILIEISDTDTAALAFFEGVYDLELESASGIVTRLLEGSVKLSHEVTK